MLLEKIYAETMTNNGYSVNIPSGETPSGGFMVSLPNKELKVSIESFNPQILRNYINSTPDLHKPNLFLGTWVEDDFVYIDASEMIIDKETAIREGIKRGQLAIYDVVKKDLIYLPEPQKSGTLTQQQTYLNMKVQELL